MMADGVGSEPLDRKARRAQQLFLTFGDSRLGDAEPLRQTRLRHDAERHRLAVTSKRP